MTTVLRPKVLETTLNSLKEYLKGDYQYRLIINIDCVGEDVKVSDIEKIINDNFENNKIIISKKPSFPLAFKNTIKNSESEFVFFWEDDMELRRDVDIDKMIKIHKKNKKLASLTLDLISLRNSNNSYFKYEKNREIFVSYNFKAGFTCNPTMFKGSFIRKTTKYIGKGNSPQKTLRMRRCDHLNSTQKRELNDIMENYEYGLFLKPEEPGYVTDIGKEWKFTNGFKKRKEGVNNTWIKHSWKKQIQ